MKILVIDNYDSFVFNLVYMLRQEKTVKRIDTIRNDKVEMDKVAAYDKILLSPGPGLPSEAGQMNLLLKEYADKKSILGVCLGHQALAENYGARLQQLSSVKHGQSEVCRVENQSDLFRGLESQIQTAHYHSWVVDRKTISSTPLKVTAEDQEGRIMALQHEYLPLYGLQFHPESVMCEQGSQIIKNWIYEK